MTAFWGIAAVLVLIALAFVIAPLLGARPRPETGRARINAAIYRERLRELEQTLQGGELEHAREELVRGLYEETRDEPGAAPGAGSHDAPPGPSPLVPVALAGALPLAAILTYVALGQPALVLDAPVPAPAPSGRGGAGQTGAPGEQGVPSVEQMVARLEARLAKDPNDLDGWLLLGRSYVELDQLETARETYERGLKVLADEPELLIAYAEVLGRMQGNRLAGRPASLLRKAVARAPTHPKGLWLAGIAALQEGRTREALRHWAALRASQSLSAEDSKLLERFEAQARALLGGAAPGPQGAEREPALATAEPRPTPAETLPRSQAAAPGSAPARLQVQVTLAGELSRAAAPGDTVFIFARAAKGPRMPLAIVRKRVSDLPVSVTLDDAMAMMPAMKLSAFPRVVVGARISRTGSALASPGDLEGESPVIELAQTDTVAIEINRTVP